MANHTDTGSLRRGPWLEEEDEILTATVGVLGEKHWDALAKQSGLRRSGKSCRLRWMNYLRPNLKHGEITQEEEAIILDLHKQWGSKWSKIAKRLPGRTDNEIKNYWRSHLKKKSEAQQADTESSTKQDIAIPKYNRSLDNNVMESSVSENKGIFGISSSETTSEICNMNALMGNESPYESRISEWISSSSDWSNEVKDDEDCMGTYTYPCFCQLESSSHEETKISHSVWDLWNPIW